MLPRLVLLVSALAPLGSCARAEPGARLSPCRRREDCPRISTSLLSRPQYLHLQARHGNYSNSAPAVNTVYSFPKKKRLIELMTSWHSVFHIIVDVKFCSRSQKRRVRARHRSRRSSSSIRTIVKLNSKQEADNKSKWDPKILWSKKKCHKYAMFKVKSIDLNFKCLRKIIVFKCNRCLGKTSPSV